MTNDSKDGIAIVGGGLMGVLLAYRLTQQGKAVTLFESDNQLGGLTTWQDFGLFRWDRFYHVILPTDKYLIAMVEELGLKDQLQWRRSQTGYFVNRKLYSISTNMEFLKFPLLSLFAKVRLAWTLWYGSKIDNWRQLESMTSAEWLQRNSGKHTYEVFWKPLLLAKLGSTHVRVSAVFIWAYIKRLYAAKDSSSHAGHLGHVRGGYYTIFSQLEKQIRASGGVLRTGVAVKSIRAVEDQKLELITDDNNYVFDSVICTSPTSVLREIVEGTILRVNSSEQDVEYLGVVCVILVTTKPPVPYYVVNIADSSIPFTGIIGMSTVVDPDQTANKYLTYLPRYMLSTDDEFKQDDSYFRSNFINGLKRMLPDFDMDSIVESHVHRAAKVQPLQVINYSRYTPDVQTLHPKLYVLNTSQFVDATLNNNEVVRSVNSFCDEYGADIAADNYHA